MSTFASRDGTTLHELHWPAESPKGGVAIIHGYGEHIGRYDHVGKALAARGLTARGVDFRGHGQSAGARGHIQRFDEYLDDLAALIARCPERPLFLLAHSMGALVATEYLLKHGSDPFSGVVLSSPYYGLKLRVSPVKIYAGKFFSSLLPKLGLPTGLKGADVCRDPELQKLYDSDPLNNKNATARWFTEATAAQEHVAAHAGEIKVPLLMMQGAGDRVADPDMSRKIFDKLSSADKTLSWLEGQYHEVFNEPADIRDKNVGALGDWLLARVNAGTREKVAQP
jgi:alpha-beta hydrolase superfamily lysophospholipase